LFINFGSSAVEASGVTDRTHYASGNTTIAGNIFDMTCVGQPPVARTAIQISANDTLVTGNQIYVRGPADPLVAGIRLREPALKTSSSSAAACRQRRNSQGCCTRQGMF